VLKVHLNKSGVDSSYVTTLDSLNGQDTLARKYRIWFAKFFTMFL
jgi:hypothetical protein